MAYAHLGSQEVWGSVPAAAGVILVLLATAMSERCAQGAWASPHEQEGSTSRWCPFLPSAANRGMDKGMAGQSG